MEATEWTRVWHNAPLDLQLFQAAFVRHSYPRHSHDYYVICVIERGRQSFTHRGKKYLTPPGGIILINPGEVHTGEAADELGFEMRCLYPTPAHMQMAVRELSGRRDSVPYFGVVRVDDVLTRRNILRLHRALVQGASVLECESRFTWTLAQLVQQYASESHAEPRARREPTAVLRARRYIDDHFAEGISLTALADHVSLSPYYFLRVFRAEVGMPPYAYLESVRIRHAQRLIAKGTPLAEVAAEVGFSSQSHLTHRFKQILGATPGQYAHPLLA